MHATEQKAQSPRTLLPQRQQCQLEPPDKINSFLLKDELCTPCSGQLTRPQQLPAVRRTQEQTSALSFSVPPASLTAHPSRFSRTVFLLNHQPQLPKLIGAGEV